MKTVVMETKHCPKCGRLLPPRAPSGLCPACLLAQGADTDAGPPSPPFQPPPITEITKLFPQLEIISLLGAGGMGAVYKARQPALDRFVALKILPATNTSGVNFAERFNREARALARLSHPNIVAVHEFGQAGNLHYFLMEFVDGANLRQLEQASRLSPREALQIIPQICDALQYAHDEGVVHRDIKPENVLVDRKGRVKIADFGLAKILGHDGASARLTLEGQVMGTPHYMAPEQIERPLAVDHRADIYSLGVVLYEMLTGDLPLGKFPAPSRKVEVDVRFDEVVLRALENDPSRRYQKASEVKSEVETIAGTPPPPTQDKRFHGWAGFPLVGDSGGHRRIHWKGVLIAFAVVLGLLTIAFGFVTAVTGRSLLGWIGVLGWPSLVARILISAVLVAWGLSRALQARAQAEALPSRKIILPSFQRRWKLASYSIVALVLVAVVWRVPLHTLMTKLTNNSRSVTLVQIATRDSKSGVLRAQLPGRGTIELLAVGKTNSSRGGWWAPDGTVLTNADYEVPNPVENSHSGHVSKDMLLRIRDLPSGASMTGIRSEPDGGVGSGGTVFRDGKPLSGAFQARLAFKPPLNSANLQVGLGIDAWRIIGTISADGRSQNQTRRPGDPNWKLQFHHDPIDTADGAQIAVVFGPENRMWTYQFVAVATNGVEHTANSSQGTPIEGVTLWTYRFQGLKLAQLKEFRAQVRPVHWVEFPGVALEPRGPLTPTEPRAFGRVFECAFDEAIDFDTGVTTNLPTRGSRSHPVISENVAWMQKNGFDAVAGAGEELRTLEMDFILLQNGDWDTLSADELSRRIYRNYYHPAVVKPQNGSTTFGFRTREHGVGILRFVAFATTNRPGLNLQYRLVQRSKGE